jgi:hypothetical protein
MKVITQVLMSSIDNRVIGTTSTLSRYIRLY